MVIIRWGPLGWITPVKKKDCKPLASRYEAKALKEAEEWLRALEEAE